MDVRALVFDVFGTVVDWYGGVARDVRRLLPGVDADAFAAAWRRRYEPSMDRVRRGERAWAVLDTLHRESLDALLDELGQDADEVTRAELVLAWHRLDPWPDSVAGLTELRERFVVASLSNANVSLLVDMAKRARLPWDAVLSAELFGHYKPDAEVYDGAARLLGLAPEQVLMVAAHVDDLAAARRRGLRTAYVYRPDEAGPRGAPPATDPEADLNVASLKDLAARLVVG
ncbi:haloacid dehalogenase type II [Pseudonocardia charpentierae]|uniref:Haloacid dehalogenase type II n=1 Tax=Pseudonocardia charpentierae TaxID=3075545 RepID=A0ABU2NE28_9PSEU|nr:haloacid dehalogenase type II [Pseudonocardia sp. DSM 45834]MDT0352205.1 haloacid dehalogenase type II [Pseudonocardia sp. DSM 45834]